MLLCMRAVYGELQHLYYNMDNDPFEPEYAETEDSERKKNQKQQNKTK